MVRFGAESLAGWVSLENEGCVSLVNDGGADGGVGGAE